MSGAAPRIFLSAGEPSGDLHGSALVRALRARFPNAEIEALGGPRMAAAGASLRYPLERYSVIGFAEVVRAVPAHWLLLRRLTRAFQRGRYDLVIPIDYPGFNLRLAESARRHGIKVLYYVAPKYWASGEGRTARLRSAVDRLAVILPFEQRFFSERGVAAEYVGHPLLDREPAPAREAARAALGIAAAERVLALFPGSRAQEVARLWKPFRDAGAILLRQGRCDRVLVATVGSGDYPDAHGFVLQRDASQISLAAADVALVKSGTATLEAALANVPMVVAYRVHWLTAGLARRLLTVRWISLVNLIAEREVVEELTQDEVSPERLAEALAPLLERESPAGLRQRDGFRVVRERLGTAGASARVAELAAQLLA